MPVTVSHTATFTCDRCGKQNTVPTDVEDPAQVPLPDNWRHMNMQHPDDPTTTVTWVLHPACARDFQEKFAANLSCPPRDPAT